MLTVTRFVATGSLVLSIAVLQKPSITAQNALSGMPVFEMDLSWPKLPNNWVLGQVAGVETDRRDHVWIVHRPRSVPEPQRGQAAPAVLEFDAQGRFVRGWGGPGDAYEWPSSEHGIDVDPKGNIWIAGNGVGDDMLLKFTGDGQFIMQVGKRGQSTGNADTVNVNRPADVFVYSKTNELFVADGYGNRRVIVFDADTGKFKRMWGAFGKPPDSNPPDVGAPGGGGRGRAAGPPGAGAEPARDGAAGRGRGAQPPFPLEGPGPETFANPVHSVEVSNDGLVYIGDRSNRRIQVFTLDGTFVTQTFVNRAGAGGNSASGMAFSPDPAQTFLYNADFGNARITVLDRKSLKELYAFGERGDQPGQMVNTHLLAADTKGNLYTGEVLAGHRAFRFVLKGVSQTPPPNALLPTAVSTSSGQAAQ
jgi:hypothetical protein